MTESFYATLKIITGEEILAEVMGLDENGTEFFIVNNPIVISESFHIDHEKGVAVGGLMPKKWLLYSNEDTTIIYKQHVVCISEMDKFGISFYRKALIAAKISSPIKKKVETEKNTGYLGKIESFRKAIQNTFDSSPDLTKE